MNNPFPRPITQLGFVVRDLDGAMNHWIHDLSVGPFYYAPRIEPDEFEHRGNRGQAPFAAALGNSGSVQIELVLPLENAPSMWQEFLDSGREGLQHVAYWTDSFDADFDAATQAGYTVGHRGVLAGGRFVYFDCGGGGGLDVELSEQSPAKHAVFGAIREAAADWDGQDPVRQYADLLRVVNT